MFGKDNKEDNKEEEKVEKLKAHFIKRIYKVTVQKIDTYSEPVTEYTNLKTKDENDENEYAYLQTGVMKEVEKDEKTIYEQKFEEGDLDVRELTLWANRVK